MLRDKGYYEYSATLPKASPEDQAIPGERLLQSPRKDNMVTRQENGTWWAVHAMEHTVREKGAEMTPISCLVSGQMELSFTEIMRPRGGVGRNTDIVQSLDSELETLSRTSATNWAHSSGWRQKSD